MPLFGGRPGWAEFRSIEALLERIDQRLGKLEQQMDDHAKEQNGHPQHRIKGVPVIWWVVVLLVLGITGSDFAVDVIAAFVNTPGG